MVAWIMVRRRLEQSLNVLLKLRQHRADQIIGGDAVRVRHGEAGAKVVLQHPLEARHAQRSHLERPH